MHIQILKTHSKIFSRVSALFLALVICVTLAVSAFADMTGGMPVVVNGGKFVASFDDVAYAYTLPSSAPSTSSNYLCWIAPEFYSTRDERTLHLYYLTFSNSSWNIDVSGTTFLDSHNNYVYNMSHALGSSSYTSLYHATLTPNSSAPEWYLSTEQPNGLFLGLVATSKDINGFGTTLLKARTYKQGYDGDGKGVFAGDNPALGGNS